MSFLQTAKRWGSKSALSILDQGILSLVNFVINIHLSRVLSPQQYGLFAIVFSVYLLILSFNQALILEPLNIVGMTRYKNNQINYFKKIALIQFLASVLVSGLLLIGIAVLWHLNNQLYFPLLSLAIAGPFICSLFLVRRFCYLLYEPGIAFIGTLCYAVIVVVLYYLLLINGKISVFNIFLLFGIASVTSSIILAVILNRLFPHALKNTVGSKTVAYKHWKLGKWLLGSSMIGWLSSSIYFPLVGIFSGLEATAAYKAIDNLLLPMQQVITALSLLIIPRIAGKNIKDTAYLKGISLKLSIYFTAAVLIYLVSIFLFRDKVIHLLYGPDSIYIEYAWLFPLVGLSLIARSVSDIGIGVSLRIAQRFDVLFKSTVANTLFMLTFGFLLIWQYGILGAGLGVAIGAITQLIISFLYFKKVFN